MMGLKRWQLALVALVAVGAAATAGSSSAAYVAGRVVMGAGIMVAVLRTLNTDEETSTPT